MKFTTTALALFLGIYTPAQYGGPPMWDRNADDYSVPRGPQMDPCIRRGDCWGVEHNPRYPPGWYDPQYERPMRRIPRFPRPGQRQDWDEDYD
jgi:hypothetical protein